MKYERVVIAAILISLLAFMVTGCSDRSHGIKEDDVSERFAVEIEGTYIQILTDNQTGVQYLVYKTQMGTGITKLEAGEGNG